MKKNPIRSAHNYNLRIQDWLGDLNDSTSRGGQSLICRALVLDVDRVGGRFLINRTGNDGENGMSSSPFTLKVRLLNGSYNLSDGLKSGFLDADEWYVLPMQTNIMDIPERGEVVLVQFDNPFTDGASVMGFWIGREPSFADRDYRNTFTRTEASQGKEITHTQAAIYGGERPKTIDSDYDIKPNWDVSFPETRRWKAGDMFMMGKQGQMIHLSYDAEKKANKESYIEIGTRYDFIENVDGTPPADFNWDTATPEEITAYQKMQRIHNAKYLDFSEKSRWEFLNNLGSRVILTTNTNVDARLIHHDTEKDWTGKFGNVQILFDKNYRDEGPGINCGQEIESKQIHEKVDFSTTHGDVITVKANNRNPIVFDTNTPTIFMESEEFRFISRKGKEVNHGVLGEVQGRWLMKVLMLIMHLIRSVDLLNDRVHKLSLDFLTHRHALIVGQTLSPLGSPDVPGKFISRFPWYKNTTDGGSLGDSGSFDQSGSDTPSMKIKDRLTEERSIAEGLIQEIPEQHSTTMAYN